MPNISNDKSLENNLLAIFKASLFSAAAIIFIYALTFKAGLSNDHQRWSEFGAFIGGTVGPLISFFAFFALLLTIILQNKAIRISKEELGLTREELTLTREELAKTSASAESQARHFITEAKINDIVESINQIERTITSKRNYTLPIFDDRQNEPQPVALECFLGKDMERVSHLSSGERDLINDPNLRPEEIGDLFKVLFDQLMLLQNIPEATNRYRVLMHRNLETFFLLAQVAALPFDWTSPLDEESKSWIKVYEKNLRSYKSRNKQKRAE
ncbi:MAG: hypothetical protein FH754_00205 [Marinobacter sp.]|mgnify:CR=1 FL=1|jgi:hypothetical protein|nr:hypothetical protein [Marinobacter sp.]